MSRQSPHSVQRCDRRKFLKRATSTAAAFSFAAPLLSSCQREGADPASRRTLTLPGDPVVSLFTTMADEFFTSFVAGTLQCATALGLTYDGFVNENKPEIQLSQFETAAGREVKMITVVPPDVANVPAIFRRANEYQVYTVMSSEIPRWYFPHQEGEYAVSFVTPFDFNSYYDVCRVLLEHLNGRGKVLMLTGFPGGTPDQQRTAAAMQAIEEFPGIELLGSLPGRWNRLDGRKAMEDLITAHPDFDAVISLNDEMAIGALAALDDAGRAGVPIIGHNGTMEIMGFIESGRVLATSATFPAWVGAYMVVLAFDAANGWKPSLPERMMIEQHAVIDKNNLQIYQEKFGKNIDNLPFDFRKMSKVLHPQDWDPQNLVYPMNVNDYFGEAPRNRGFEMPGDWQKAMDMGEMEKVSRMYADHYKMKMLAW